MLGAPPGRGHKHSGKATQNYRKISGKKICGAIILPKNYLVARRRNSLPAGSGAD